VIPLGFVHRHVPEEDQQSDAVLVVENNDLREDETGTEKRLTWPHDHTVALIDVVQTHYEEMYDVKKRKHFWMVISQELESLCAPVC
jgi:hypothetical protein